MRTFREALLGAGHRPSAGESTDKKNYAERLSRHLATLFANLLRDAFPQITPDEGGGRQEAPARTAKGTKKLDVNYSTPELGLGLGVSIKTLNFRDGKSARYTKNYSRIENELRAEAMDYHERQPWSVLVAVIFLPVDACDDYNPKSNAVGSSFGQAVRHFRNRANRREPSGAGDLFERVFVGAYSPEPDDPWGVRFLDVMSAPPKSGRPEGVAVLTIEQVIEEIVRTYDARNNPPFVWAGE